MTNGTELQEIQDKPHESKEVTEARVVLDIATIEPAAVIQAGEQLTISYDYAGEGSNPRKKSWFEIHQVEKIDPTEHNRRGDLAGRPSQIKKERS